MGLAEDQFTNDNPNFATVTFNVTDGWQKIDPIDATVTITGHHNTTDYDGAAHSVSGYDVEISEPLYKESDFTFSGTAEAGRTDWAWRQTSSPTTTRTSGQSPSK